MRPAPRIELLADHPAAVSELGRWMHAAWPTPGRSAGEGANLFRKCMNRDRVPMALIALDGEQPAGTVALLDRSVV